MDDRLGYSDIQRTMNIYAHVTKIKNAGTPELFGDFMVENLLGNHSS